MIAMTTIRSLQCWHCVRPCGGEAAVPQFLAVVRGIRNRHSDSGKKGILNQTNSKKFKEFKTQTTHQKTQKNIQKSY